MTLAEAMQNLRYGKNLQAVYDDLLERLEQARSGTLVIPTPTEDEDVPSAVLEDVIEVLTCHRKEAVELIQAMEQTEQP